MSKGKTLKFKYKNWEGKTAEREVVPIEVWFGETKWHKGKQWFLKAKDVTKDAERNFALKDVLKFL